MREHEFRDKMNIDYEEYWNLTHIEGALKEEHLLRMEALMDQYLQGLVSAV